MLKLICVALLLGFVGVSTAQAELIYVTASNDGTRKFYWDKYSLKYREGNDNIRFVYVTKIAKNFPQYDGMSEISTYMQADCRQMKTANLKIQSTYFSGEVKTLTADEFEWDPPRPGNAVYMVTKAACAATHKEKNKKH
jgi:hypothetical protein